eukprot:GHVU01030959.1.p1 GENE.GHVU01030959.1~~GHVU01030959.1.p1  ORF type:complete len:124 (+),score=1.42 GHVU01030959.1:35-373(+)
MPSIYSIHRCMYSLFHPLAARKPRSMRTAEYAHTGLRLPLLVSSLLLLPTGAVRRLRGSLPLSSRYFPSLFETCSGCERDTRIIQVMQVLSEAHAVIRSLTNFHSLLHLLYH